MKLTWERPEYANGELMGYYVFKERLKNGEPIDTHVQHELIIADPNVSFALPQNVPRPESLRVHRRHPTNNH